MTKSALNFKLEYGKEEITPYAGLGLYGEMYRALGLDKEINGTMPKPGSGKGFKSDEYVKPLVLMFLGGGKYIEDIRKIQADKGLKEIEKYRSYIIAKRKKNSQHLSLEFSERYIMEEIKIWLKRIFYILIALGCILFIAIYYFYKMRRFTHHMW